MNSFETSSETKRAVLTGAGGYIGQFAVTPLAERGYAVHAVSSRAVDTLPTGNVTRHQVDLLDKGAVEEFLNTVRPTHLLHLAWYVEHGKFWNAPENSTWLDASIYLARKFVECGGRRFVFAGTCAEYDWNAPSPFFENSTPISPGTPYGEAKAALGRALTELAFELDFSAASGRIFFPFGANEPPNRLIPSVIRALLQETEAKTTHGEQIRDLMPVEDTAAALAALLDSDVRGAVNIGTGEGRRIKDVVTSIGEILGKTGLLRIGALPAPVNEPGSIVADVTRLRNEVNYESRVSLHEALENTIEWWKEHL